GLRCTLSLQDAFRILASASAGALSDAAPTPRRALRDMGVWGSVRAMDGAPAAAMDGFTAVPQTPISRRARPAPTTRTSPTRADATAHRQTLLGVSGCLGQRCSWCGSVWRAVRGRRARP